VTWLLALLLAAAAAYLLLRLWRWSDKDLW
jgi:uncharacterized protein involved in response to NO